MTPEVDALYTPSTEIQQAYKPRPKPRPRPRPRPRPAEVAMRHDLSPSQLVGLYTDSSPDIVRDACVQTELLIARHGKGGTGL